MSLKDYIEGNFVNPDPPKKKILIIEDDEILRNMYVKKLQLEHFDVDIAPNGDEGLQKMRTYQPDLVLLDLMMPKKNGFQVMDEVKNDSELQKIPIIILTNIYADAKEFLNKGAINYIIKSDVTPAQVVDKIRGVFASLQQNS